jgi:hypothetical protein
MSDYRGQAERLREWNVLDIQNHPTLTLGMLRSAGAALERLSEENERLNHENFWLSKNQKSPEEQGRSVKLPPFDKGDKAWGINRNKRVQSGMVGLIEIVDGKVVVAVKGVCRGVYGKDVFATKEEAEEAMKNG